MEDHGRLVDEQPPSTTAPEGVSRGKPETHVATVQTEEPEQEARESNLLTVLEVNRPDLTLEEQCQVSALVGEYADLFALTSAELGRTASVEHTINTADCRPVKQAPRRLHFSLRKKVIQLVDEIYMEKDSQKATDKERENERENIFRVRDIKFQRERERVRERASEREGERERV